MTLGWVLNLGAYSLQIAVLTVAAAVLVALLRVREPGARLGYWQAVLAACVVLPLVQPWLGIGAVVSLRRFEASFTQLPAKHAAIPWPGIADALLVAFIAVTVIRFGLLLFGVVRLRRLRRHSRLLPGAFRVLQQRTGTDAEIRVSEEIDGPVTFGLRRPVVLLPRRWSDSESVVCHELLHVRRMDWLATLAEEFIRSVLWFHPCAWWLVAEIRLAREQVVDREVVRLTESREQYLDALLAIAGERTGLGAAPAPTFFTRPQLRQRVACLLNEVAMSTLRIRLSLLAGLCGVAAAAYFSARAFPLHAAYQTASAAANPRSDAPLHVKDVDLKPKVIFKRQPSYPQQAKNSKTQGTVVLQIVIGKSGTVEQVERHRGDPVLAAAAEDAVRQWKFAPAMRQGAPVRVFADVEVNFTLKD